MMVMTKEHQYRMERAERKRFLRECITKLMSLAVENPYPEDKSLYEKFSEAAYHKAAGYGLDDFPHHMYPYMVAWHIKGTTFIEYDEELLAFFSDTYVPSFAKFEKLLSMIDTSEEEIAQIRGMA